VAGDDRLQRVDLRLQARDGALQLGVVGLLLELLGLDGEVGLRRVEAQRRLLQLDVGGVDLGLRGRDGVVLRLDRVVLPPACA